MAICYGSLDKMKESFKYFEKALSVNSKSPYLLYNYGVFCLNDGNIITARKNLEKALKFKPEKEIKKAARKALNSINKLVKSELKDKDIDEKTFIKLGERYENAVSYMKNKKYDLAKKELKLIVSKDKQSYKGNGNLGLLFLLEGDFDKAEKHLYRALEINPEYTPAFNNLIKLQEVKQRIKKEPEFLKELAESGIEIGYY